MNKINRKPSVSIIVPCFNEQEVIKKSYKELKNVLEELISKDKISGDSNIYFVDDGSIDTTRQIIECFNGRRFCILSNDSLNLLKAVEMSLFN